jgi:hypothetical protein
MISKKDEQGKFDLEVTRGDTFTFYLIYKDDDGNVINLTGYTTTLSIKSYPNYGQIATYTENDPQITVTPLEGKIEVNLKPADTEKFSFGTAIYSIAISQSEYKKTLLYGDIIMKQRS